MKSTKTRENRADAVRVLLALGVLALLASFDKAGATNAPLSTQIESALAR